MTSFNVSHVQTDTLKAKVDDCFSALHDQRLTASPADRVEFKESFVDLEFDVLVQGRFNLSVPDCFSATSPYYLKDFCVFECPFLTKQKSKSGYVGALADFQQLAKSMQKNAAIIPRHNHRIAVITSSYGSSSGKPFFDVHDAGTKSLDRFDLKGDLSHLPNIVANYRYVLVDLQQHTVCTHLILQLIFFSKRTVLVPASNPTLTVHSEVAPFVLQLPTNRVTNDTFSFLFRNAAENHLQSLASFRFAMNFFPLKRRCTNLRHYHNWFMNATSTVANAVDMKAYNASSLYKGGRGHHSRANRHNRLRHQRGGGGSSNVAGESTGEAAAVGEPSVDNHQATGKVVVVLSHTAGDFHAKNTSWLVGYDHVILDHSGTAKSSFSDGGVTGHLRVVDSTAVKESGQHVADYLRYIISSYHHLPDFMIFAHTRGSSDTHGHLTYSLDDLHHDVYHFVEEVKDIRPENSGFAYLGSHCQRFFAQLPKEMHYALHGYFAQWLEFPLNRWFAPGGFFVVSKAAVLRRSLDSYMTLLRLVDYQSVSAATQSPAAEIALFDMTWPSVFRSSCVVGNHDDCMLRHHERCDVVVGDESAIPVLVA